MRSLGIRTLWVAATLLAAAGAAGGGCGGGGTSSGSGGTSSHSSSSTTTTSSSSTSSSGSGGMASSSSSSSSSSGTGGGASACMTAAKGATRGSAIALTSDDLHLVTVNRDVGSVTVMSIDYSDGQPKMTVVKELTGLCNEPWQVAIDGCDATAYVVCRKDQKVVEITGISGTPAVGGSINVGSEPTSLALSPDNTKLYVSNWVDGTLSIVDPVGMKMTGTVDFNTTIAATGLLGQVTSRPALAHPRGVAVNTDGTVYVTEWFALRTGPEDKTGTNSDHNWKGLLYKVAAGATTATAIDLPPINDTGFQDAKGQATGCFPNQVASVTIDGGFAYVTSTCASPVGPVGVFQRGACTVTAQCAAFGVASMCGANGVCTNSCVSDADCGGIAQAGDCVGAPSGTCKPTVNNAKTTTHPAVTVVDLTAGTGTTTNLDKGFAALPALPAGVAPRMPLLPTDMDFKPGFAYVAGEGADALFRITVNNGAFGTFGSATNNFIDMHTPIDKSLKKNLRLPIGLATSKNKLVAFVANDGSRDVAAIDLNAQAIAGVAANMDFRITQSTALPTAGTPEDSVLTGKRFFTTGLGRWSLKGAAWGSCAACHIDGLSDNVTWYFARGPRQTTSLDGTFSKTDPTDQRVLNWTAVNDEIADFEGNIRGISGGVGALVTTAGAACAVATQTTDCPNSQVCNPTTLTCNIDPKDRINTAAQTPPQQGLQGSSTDAASAAGSAHPHSVIQDWIHVTDYVKAIRSPRKPSNLVPGDVTAGKAIFGDPTQGNCIGCHSGAKWTISKVFYTPGDIPNAATADPATTSLSNTTWNKTLNGFPAALFPATAVPNQNMRFGAPPGAEQLQCVLRPVGTIGPIVAGIPGGISDSKVNVLELRQDMATGAQGAGDPGLGFNPPSLLGLQVGAPYFHAGNARTLEESLSALFKGHYQSAVAQVFNPDATAIKNLVAYMLSIDASEPAFAVPAKGNKGGDICFYP